MALHHVAPGEVVDLLPVGEDLKAAHTAALVKTASFEAVRIVLHAGGELPAHKVAGAITLQCLTGRVRLSLSGQEILLGAGQWVYLQGGAPHSVGADEDSAFLLTILFPPSEAE